MNREKQLYSYSETPHFPTSTYQVLLNPNFHDLKPILAGASRNAFGEVEMLPTNSHTVIHYVIKGHGMFRVEDRLYPVHAGQAMLSLPTQETAHIGDPEDPFRLYWVGFTGTLSHRFSELPPVFDVPPVLFDRLCDPGDLTYSRATLEHRLAGELSLLYSALLGNKEKTPSLAQQICDFINEHYMEPLSVQNMAQTHHISRCYLSRQFKAEMGCTVQEYILNVRIQMAKYHLMLGTSVSEAAELSGFRYLPNFTKLYTRQTGKTPTGFKKFVKNNIDAFKSSEKK